MKDVACIDQNDQEGKQRGIRALPLIIAQCDAMISIIDCNYPTRAWCAIEVSMMQTLRDSYGMHEHFNYSTDDVGIAQLVRADTVPPIQDNLKGLKLSFPDVDGPIVKFLARQIQIMGKD